MNGFSFIDDVVKPLMYFCGAALVLTGVVIGLNELFPSMSQRPEPVITVVKNNGYTCVKVQGERASTCTKDAP